MAPMPPQHDPSKPKQFAEAVPGEPSMMRFMVDTTAAAVLALALVGMAISVIGLIGCGIAALLTRRR
jgi:hypothetical protein